MLRKLTPYLFVAPLMIFIALFTYIPILASLNLSFREWNFLSPSMPFVGFRNYEQLLASRELWNSLWVTALFAVLSVPLRLGLALIVATHLVRESMHVRLLRELCFCPR